MGTDREEAAIGAASEMATATDRLRDSTWMAATQRWAESAVGEIGDYATFDLTSQLGLPVLAVKGNVDVYSAPALRQRLLDLVSESETDVVADLRGVRFMDSAGLSVLVGALKRARQAHRTLLVVASGAPLEQVFRTTGIYKVLPLWPSVEAAASASGHTTP